jgi:hypothetical protein
MPAPALEILVPAIATLLGAHWTARPDHTWGPSAWELVNSDGRRIQLHVGDWESNKGRILVYGDLPPNPADEKPYTADLRPGSITLAGTSTAERTAAEISRRLMPSLDTAHREWRTRVAQLRNAEQARVAAARALAQLPGLSKPVRNRHMRTETAYHLAWDGEQRGPSYHDRAHARVEVDADQGTGSAHVGMTLSGLSPAQAGRVLRALTEQPAPPASTTRPVHRHQPTAQVMPALF